MSHRAGNEKAFTLIELVIVVMLIGILAAISSLNIRAALLTVKVQATASDLKIFQDAIRSVAGDCSTLPRWTATTDPGLAFRPTWATGGCWKGPYMNNWLAATPLGGTFRYIGQRNQPPRVRVQGIDVGAARLLAAKIESQFGASALGTVAKSGQKWNVDLIVRDTVNVK